MLVFPRVPSLVILLSDSPWVTVIIAMVLLTCDAFQVFFFLPNITLSFCCAPDSFILFPLPIEHFTIDIIQVNWRWGTWPEKNHTAEYRMPVACTLNSASSSTLPNFDPLIFSSVCSSFFTTNLSSHCKPQQWLWLSLSRPRNSHLLSLPMTLLSAVQWKRNHHMAALFSFSPTDLSTYPFFPSLQECKSHS